MSRAVFSQSVRRAGSSCSSLRSNLTAPIQPTRVAGQWKLLNRSEPLRRVESFPARR